MTRRSSRSCIRRRETPALRKEAPIGESRGLHPMGDIPATQLFEMRIGELALHGGDLTRAIGADETLDPEVVAAVGALYAR